MKSMRTFNIIVEQGVDGYLISSVIELPGCHTQGKNLDELYQRTKEAIELYLGEKKSYKPVSKFVGLQQISV
jgi:predicted RNase H-like HicB family nuclease